MRAEHPGIRVEITQYELETTLHKPWARDFDLVVTEQYPCHATPHYLGLDRRPLTLDSIQLGVSTNTTSPQAVDSLKQATALP
ncbi:hypothetical protein JOE65_001959 [Arthrobacter roseus]|nr:hypothetical protein [Arthrobacter roseus]